MFSRIELLAPSLHRPDISHAIFDFDGTLSWLRHGWPQIMLDLFLAHAPAAWREDTARRAQLSADILSLNGKPSIHQMERFAERLESAGVKSPSPDELLALYQHALRRAIDERIASIRDGRCTADDFVVHGARGVLEQFVARGVRLVILSGTVEHEVRAEAELLGLTPFFGEHIFGSPAQGSFSKKDVIDRILREERIEGRHLLAFGDGPVEIHFTKAVGGLAIGVASNEEHNGSHGMDQAKREQLVRAGADAVMADYAEGAALLEVIFGA
jgi:phosphoglycolate phosphatase